MNEVLLLGGEDEYKKRREYGNRTGGKRETNSFLFLKKIWKIKM